MTCSVALKRLLAVAEKATQLPYLDDRFPPFYLRSTGEWRTRLPDYPPCRALTLLDIAVKAAKELRHIPKRNVIFPVYMRDGRWRFKADRVRLLNRSQMNARGGSRIKVSKAELAAYERPTHYSDCLPGGINAARPCPWVSCRSHLYLTLSKKGSLKIAFPGKGVEDLETSCLNDVLARHKGELSLEHIGQAVGVTHQRVSQILKKVLKDPELREVLREHIQR
jgi:hypothetical protein